MTIRRILLATLTAGLVVAGPLGTTAANASFATSAGLGSMSVASAAIPAPSNFTGSLTCGASNSTMAATWTASTARSVSGYLITVYFSDGYKQTVQLGSTATSWSASITTFNVTAYQVQYSVTTQTTYGWTKESARTAWFQC